MASNAVELAVGYISIVPEMRGVAAAVNQALGHAQNQGTQAGQAMGDNMSGGLKKAMLAGAAGVGLAVGAVLGKALAGAIEGEVSTDKLSAGLGLSPADSKKAGQVAGRLYGQAYGESVGEVSSAVDAVFSSLNKTGINFDDGSAERAAQKALNLASVYGTDVAESAQTVNQLINQGLAKNADEGFDLLTASFQRVPAAMRAEIPELMNEYGTFFSGLGFNGQEAFGVLVNASEQGKIAMDKVGDALKETGIRATDLGDTGAVEALNEIGLGGANIQNRLLEGGATAKTAFNEMVTSLLKIQDPAKQAEAAIALFGTPLEDLNKEEIPAFLQSFAGAGAAMDGFGGSADQLGTALSDNLATKIEVAKRTVIQGLTTFVGSAVLPALSGLYNGVAAVFGPAFQAVKDSIAIFIGAFTGNGSDVEVPWMNTIIDIASRARGIFDEVKAGYGALVAAFNGQAQPEQSGLVGFLQNLGGAARSVYDVWNSTILPALKTVGEIMLNVGQVIVPILFGAFESIIGVVSTVADKIGDVVGWFNQHKDVVVTLAAVIGTALLPVLIPLGISLAGQALAWGASTAAMITHKAVGTALSVATKAWAAAQWLLNAALNANPISLIILAIGALIGGIVLAYRNSETFRDVVQSVWEAIQTAISFAWESVIKPVFEALKTALGAVGDFFGWVWNSLIKPAWDALGTGIDWVWQNVIRPAWDGLKSALQAVGDFFGFVWNSLIKPAWDALGAGIQWVVDNVIIQAWENLKGNLQRVGDFFKWVWDTIIKPAWDALGNGIRWVIDNVITPAFETLKSGLQGVKDFFGNIVDGIQLTWDRVKEIVRAPIEFLVNTIYNKGIVPAWNNVAGFIGLDDKKLSTIEGFATGGIYPGYTPGRDTGVIAVGGGEAIMRPEWTRAVGKDYVNDANAAARSGGVSGVRNFLGAYASGGIVQGGAYLTTDVQRSMWDAIRTAFPNAILTSGTRTADVGSGYDFHMAGSAIDLGGPMQQMADWIATTYPHATELFWDPGPNIDEGRPTGAIGGHSDHVHWAMRQIVDSAGKLVSNATGDGGGFNPLNWIRDKVADLFEGPIRAIGNTIPDFGSSPWGQVPRKAYDKIAEAAIGFVRGRAGQQTGSAAGSGPVVDQVKAAFAQYGWDSGSQWDAVDWIVGKESSWNPMAVNPSSGAFGLFQLNPSSGTLQQYLPDRNPNPQVQGAAGARYIKDRYGDPLAAKAWWVDHNWYDTGGIFPNNSIGINTSGKPEAVLTNDQWQLFKAFNDNLGLVNGEGFPVFVTNWPTASLTEMPTATSDTAPAATGTSTSSTPSTAAAEQSDKFDPNARLQQYGKDVAEIGQGAALEIFGLQGTLLDPEHRYWKAARDVAAGFEDERAKAAKSGPATDQAAAPQQVDNSIHIDQVLTANVEELMRKLQTLQNQRKLTYSGR
ncbi:phage-related minor tail protein [Rhodococcus ruber]|uniref:aggregation-promoting factor C-terminal-like domain-containing protein n=1 Tax=Rhodococcus ruber TaxID=1830 RepID=UPI001AE3C3E7|nr:transglycosylase SLT domain-containing protein [Rhodococcus ruber]MBP2211081.1 phage-related minor tail protein [Rhodococcus ruber]